MKGLGFPDCCQQKLTRADNKCDEEQPQCWTCIRLGLQCPGYTPVFVFRDASESISRRSAATRGRKSAARHERPDGQKQQDQQINQIEHGARLQQGSSSTHAVDFEPVSVGAKDLLPPTSTTLDHNERPQLRTDPSRSSGRCAALENATASLISYDSNHDVEDRWLSENFPTQLPSTCRDIWEGVGYANLALKRALLAFDYLKKTTDSSAKNDRSQCLELYTLALQAMSGNLARPSHITQVLVTIVTLTVFLHIEAKVGSFSGGLVHCKEADLLILRHINQLVEWQTARRVLEIWMPIKSWYSLQCLPWSAMSQPFPETTRAPILKSLQTNRQGSQSLIHALLCESKNIYIRVVLVRLFGPSSPWPSDRSWSRHFEALLGRPMDREGISALGPEEDLLVSLAYLRNELDAWHDSLDVLDHPLPSATTQPQGVLRGHLSFSRDDSLFFRSQRAATNYALYTAAQAVCSREALDFATGGDLERGSYVSPWIMQILQIISGIDWDLFLRDDFLDIGLEWVIYVLLFGSLQQEVLDAVTERVHWLEKVASAPGSTLPPWALSGLLRILHKERAQGRVALFLVTNIKSTEERWTVGSASIKHSMMIMGRVARTGASFYDVEDYS